MHLSRSARKAHLASLISLYHESSEFPDASDDETVRLFVDGRLLPNGSNSLSNRAEPKQSTRDLRDIMRAAKLGPGEGLNTAYAERDQMDSYSSRMAQGLQRRELIDREMGQRIRKQAGDKEARFTSARQAWKPLRSTDPEIQIRARKIIDALHGTEGGKSRIGEELVRETYAANELWRRAQMPQKDGAATEAAEGGLEAQP